MTKFTIHSLKKEKDDLERKLEALSEDFKVLKELLKKKESTEQAGQDGGPSLPEIKNSLQFLGDDYDDLQNLNTAAKQKTPFFDFTF